MASVLVRAVHRCNHTILFGLNGTVRITGKRSNSCRYGSILSFSYEEKRPAKISLSSAVKKVDQNYHNSVLKNLDTLVCQNAFNSHNIEILLKRCFADRQLYSARHVLLESLSSAVTLRSEFYFSLIESFNRMYDYDMSCRVINKLISMDYEHLSSYQFNQTFSGAFNNGSFFSALELLLNVVKFRRKDFVIHTDDLKVFKLLNCRFLS
jgi:hypothetical protein